MHQNAAAGRERLVHEGRGRRPRGAEIRSRPIFRADVEVGEGVLMRAGEFRRAIDDVGDSGPAKRRDALGPLRSRDDAPGGRVVSKRHALGDPFAARSGLVGLQ